MFRIVNFCKISLIDGKELKERRQKLGLARRHLAQLLGVTEDAVYRWETGSRRILPERESAFEEIEAKLKKRKSADCLKNA